MRSFWQSDTALKIFSIVCAVALWFYVIAAQNPEIEVKVKNIPVQIDSASEEMLYRATGLSVIKPTGGLKTSLTVKGRRSVIGGVDNKNIKAMVDVSEIEAVGLSDPLTINIQLPESTSLYVMNINPLQVSYSVEPRKYRSIPVEVIYSGSLADELVLYQTKHTPEEIEVWGPQSIINEIDKLVVTLNLSDIKEDFSIDCPYTILDMNGKSVDPVNVASHVEAVRVSGVIHHKKMVALSVDSSVIGSYTDLEIASISVEPKRLEVYGKFEDVTAMEDLPVVLDFSEFSSRVGEQSIPARIRLPRGINCKELPEKVTATIVLKESEEIE